MLNADAGLDLVGRWLRLAQTLRRALVMGLAHWHLPARIANLLDLTGGCLPGGLVDIALQSPITGLRRPFRTLPVPPEYGALLGYQ